MRASYRAGRQLCHLRPLAPGLLSAVALVACTTVIVPPGQVRDPVPVALLDHGRHTSLVVATPDQAMIRYAYGDWTWYALGQTGIAEAAAVLVPSKAALGRKRHPGPLTPQTVPRQIKVPIELAIYFDVEAASAMTLIDQLDAIFEANSASMVENRAYDLEFVPHPTPYSLFHNSNTVVASWLRELGVEVKGKPLLAEWDCEDRGADQLCRQQPPPDDSSVRPAGGTELMEISAAPPRASSRARFRSTAQFHPGQESSLSWTKAGRCYQIWKRRGGDWRPDGLARARTRSIATAADV